MPKKFSPQLRDRAVRMVYDRQVREGGPRAASIRAVAPQLGVGTETLRIWCNRYGPTEPAGPGEPLEEENRRLRRELHRGVTSERDPEGRLGVFRSGTRPPHNEMIAFVDMHREKFGVEAICRILGATECGFITSRGYRAAKTRPASARSARDEILIEEV